MNQGRNRRPRRSYIRRKHCLSECTQLIQDTLRQISLAKGMYVRDQDLVMQAVRYAKDIEAHCWSPRLQMTDDAYQVRTLQKAKELCCALLLKAGMPPLPLLTDAIDFSAAACVCPVTAPLAAPICAPAVDLSFPILPMVCTPQPLFVPQIAEPVVVIQAAEPVLPIFQNPVPPRPVPRPAPHTAAPPAPAESEDETETEEEEEEEDSCDFPRYQKQSPQRPSSPSDFPFFR